MPSSQVASKNEPVPERRLLKFEASFHDAVRLRLCSKGSFLYPLRTNTAVTAEVWGSDRLTLLLMVN